MLGKGTILCVDDESSVLSTTKTILARAGYAVLSATNITEAIEVVRNRTVDVILLDAVPGSEFLIDVAKRSSPDVRVVIHSGAATAVRNVDGCLLKPVSPRELLRAMAEYLDRKSTGSGD